MVPMIRRNGLSRSDIGAFELNEAFAAQVLACQRALGDRQFCRDILGFMNRSARSDGHPQCEAAPSALVTRSGQAATASPCTYGQVSMRRLGGPAWVHAAACIGGGMGGAALLE